MKHPLGRVVQHDERSRAFPIQEAELLGYAYHVRHGKILDQGYLGSCTGNAMTGALMCGPLYRTHHNYGEATAVSLYSRATELDGYPGTYPPDDTGSSGLAVCKAAKERGLIRGYEHAFTMEQALSGLQRGPVITGVDWYEGFDDPDPDTGLVELAGDIRGGHEFLVRAYDPDGTAPWGVGREAVLCDNSWGGSWGRRGSFVMLVTDWERLLAADGDVARPLRLI